VIPKQLVPLVVQFDEIALHELWVFQFKLLHEVYGWHAPTPAESVIHKHGPSEPLIHAALTVVLAQDLTLAQNPPVPAVQVELIA
jgi:hypothetical protein